MNGGCSSDPFSSRVGLARFNLARVAIWPVQGNLLAETLPRQQAHRAPSAASLASAMSRRIGAMPQLVVSTRRSFGTILHEFVDQRGDLLGRLDGVGGDVDDAGLHGLALQQRQQVERHAASCGIRSRPRRCGLPPAPGKSPRIAATRRRAYSSSRCWPGCRSRSRCAPRWCR